MLKRGEAQMMRVEAEKLTDDFPVPIKWVFFSLGLSVSTILAVLGASLAIGNWTAQVSINQTMQSQRIAALETQHEQSLEFRRILFEKLAVLETKVDAIKEQKHFK